MRWISLKRVLLAVLISVLTLSAWPHVPAGARIDLAVPHAAVPLAVTPAVATPGSVVTLGAPAGTFPPGAVAVINFKDSTNSYANVLVAKTPVQADGSLASVFALPQEAAPGPATLFATVNGATTSTVVTIGPVIRLSVLSGQAGSTVEVNGAGFISYSTFSFQIGNQTAGVLGNEPVIANLYGSFVAEILIPTNSAPGPVTIIASDGVTTSSATFVVTTTTSVPVATATVPVAAAPAPTPIAATTGSTVAYFAEGYTGRSATNHSVTFNESLNMLNTTTSSIPVTITYFVQGTGTVVVHKSLPASSSVRESVNSDVGSDRLVAAAVEAATPIAVSRTIARVSASGTALDGSATQATSVPALQWGFPEGYTGSTFQEYLTLLNPTTSQATVRIVLAPDAPVAGKARSVQLIVPPTSRATANIRALNAGSAAKSVGMIVTSDVPIVAERVEYFGNGSGSAKFGSIVSAGIPHPGTALFAAFGSSGGTSSDQSFVTILHPGLQTDAISVTATLADATGRPLGLARTVLIQPGTRKTIAVSALLGRTSSNPFSVLLRASGPVEAEEAQYFGGSPNQGSHAGVAFALTPVGITSGVLSDLATTGLDGRSMRRMLYLYNPGGEAEQVAAIFYDRSGATARASYDVPAHGITSVQVSGSAPNLLTPGPLGASLALAPTSSGSFLAWSVGLTAGGGSATEDVAAGVP